MGLRSGCFGGRREAAAPGGSTTMSRLSDPPVRDTDTQEYRRETARDSRIAESGSGVNDIAGGNRNLVLPEGVDTVEIGELMVSSKTESCKGWVGLAMVLMLCLHGAAFAQAPAPVKAE